MSPKSKIKMTQTSLKEVQFSLQKVQAWTGLLMTACMARLKTWKLKHMNIIETAFASLSKPRNARHC